MVSRRSFIQMLMLAAGASALRTSIPSAQAAANMMYDPPRFGNLSFMHIGGGHGQLLPCYFRETASRMGVGENKNDSTHLVGERFLEYFHVIPSSLMGHALTHLHYEETAAIYGQVGGLAYLSSVIKTLRVSRPNSLLLDSGDSWQGSALSSLLGGRDMADMSRLLGVDAMTGDWEFSLGAHRLSKLLGHEAHGRLSFLAQNIRGHDGIGAPFRPYSIYFLDGVPVGVIGQAYPHVGRFGARDFVPEWQFGVDEESLQLTVDIVRARGVRLVVLLSHAGMMIDLKLARRVSGIDIIFSGHTHDALPEPMVVRGQQNKTIVVASGTHNKFLGLLDIDVRDGRMRDYRYRLIPIFSKLISPDPLIVAAIELWREPYEAQLGEVIAKTEGLIYRRDAFKGSFDQLVLDILRKVRQVDIAIGPGYRWGPALLSGSDVTLEDLMGYMAVGQGAFFEETLSGREIATRMEEWCDQVFNPDPYEQSGEDMVRVGGLNYRCNPAAEKGQRIQQLIVAGKPINEKRSYKVLSWGVRSPVPASSGNIWQLVATELRRMQIIPVQRPIMPEIIGAAGNFGLS